MRIFKWPLKPVDFQTIIMPVGAKLLTVQTQDDEPMVWAMCDPSAQTEVRRIGIYGTGVEMPSDPRLIYLNTFLMRRDKLVFHAFEVPADVQYAV